MAVSEKDGEIYLEKNESDALEYFSRCGYLNKQLLTEEKYFIKYMGDKWKDLSQSQKDALLDLLYVDDNIRNFYLKNGFRYHSDIDLNTKSTDEDKVDVQKSFPRLFINSGQKINVDFENDLWTWRDEHSGPFSWMSRSQQDLTLTDFDEENIARPQPRLLKVDVEAESQQKAPKQFSHIGDSWSADIIGDYKKKEPKIKLTPKISYPEKIKNKHFLEEINPAFNESCENLPNSSHPPLENNGLNGTKGKPLVIPSHNANTKDKPSKKSTNKGSLTKSSNGAIGTDRLLHKENRDILVEKKGFSNTVMEPEWSTFVGAKNVPLPPEPMVMERSDMKLTDSPYQGDDVRLIQASPSSVQQATLLSPAHSEWSEESTPDHTTYLLKGMQSPQHHRKSHTLAELSNSKKRDEEAAALDADEILKVELKGDKIFVTTENQATNDQDVDNDVPVTGFDFLDNW